MIELNKYLFIAEGSHRAVYRHPDRPDRCLKVVKPGSLESRRRNNKKWYKRLRRLSSFDETHTELNAYRRLNSRKSIRHIPLFHGMVETSMGQAMLLDFITNEDGSTARSVAQHAQSGLNKKELEQALQTLGHYLIESRLVVRDFNASDLMVKEHSNGHLTLYVVDGLGESELIPISKIPYFARKKATRRVLRFFGKVMRQYPELNLLPMSEKVSA